MPLSELPPYVVVSAVALWRMDARLRAVRRVEVDEYMMKDDMVSLNKLEKILGLMKLENQSGYIYSIDQQVPCFPWDCQIFIDDRESANKGPGLGKETQDYRSYSSDTG